MPYDGPQNDIELQESHVPEAGVLGSLLMSREAAPLVMGVVSVADFYNPSHQIIFAAMEGIYADDGVLDLITVGQALSDAGALKKVGGRAYLAELTEKIPSPLHAEGYAKMVQQRALLRRVKKMSANIGKTKDVGDVAEQMYAVIAEIDSSMKAEDFTFDQYLEEVLEERRNGKTKGIATGIKFLDDTTVCLKKGHLWVLGGLYGTGKSKVVMQMCQNIAKRGEKIIFYSLDESGAEILNFFIEVERTSCTEDQAVERVRALRDQVQIVESRTSLKAITGHLLSIPEETRPKVVFLDYLQLVETTDDDGEYERITRVSRGLKILARKAGVCIVSISQVSHASIKDKSRQIGFKGSGEVAAAANVGIMFERLDGEDVDADIVDFFCHIRKNRHGREGSQSWQFNRRINQIVFSPYDPMVGTPSQIEFAEDSDAPAMKSAGKEFNDFFGPEF